MRPSSSARSACKAEDRATSGSRGTSGRSMAAASGGAQGIGAHPLAGHRRNHPGASERLEPLDVDVDAVSPGFVGHVERDDDRVADLEDLDGQIEGAGQRRGIGHDQDGVRPAGAASEQRLDGNLFLARAGGEGVRPRQIGQLDRPAAGQRDRGRSAIDGHAGIVGDARARAGQRVEDRGLAGVGIARHQHQRVARRRWVRERWWRSCHSTSIPRASDRRMESA